MRIDRMTLGGDDVNGFGVLKYIKKYKFNSTFIRNLIAIFIVVVIPVSLMCIIVFNTSRNTLQDECNQMLRERGEKITQISNEFFKSLDMLILTLLNDVSVNHIFVHQAEKAELADDYNSVIEIAGIIKQSRVCIKEVCVYSDINKSFVTESSCTEGIHFEEQRWYQKYDSGQNNPIIFTGGMVFDNNDEITIMRCYTLNNGERLGMAAITVYANEYFKLLGLGNTNKEIFVIPVDNMCVISTNNDLLNSDISKIPFFDKSSISKARVNGDEYVCITTNSCYNDWQYIYLSQELMYQLSGKSMVSLSVGMIIVALFMCVLISLYVSLKSFRPLDDIIGYIYNGENEKELEQNEVTNELSYIKKSIVSMVNKNSHLNEKIKKTLLLLNETQICALQHQINPHFMYNTLEVIKWMAYDCEENRGTVVPMMEKLAEVVRYAIDMKRYLVSFQDEISMTKSYVEILKNRYTNRFDVVWNISDEAESLQVVKLCLQPIIENSVHHGFKSKRCGGEIWIETDISDHSFSIIVRDNGEGMTQGELEKLRNKLENPEPMSSSNVGLSNLNLRIKLIYGENFGLKIFSKSGVGTKVVLEMAKESFL